MKTTISNFICGALLGCSIATMSVAAQARDMKDFPYVKLKSLDKITARTLTFEVEVGQTVKFGSLYVKAQACRKTPPIEQPESAAFLQIWEPESPVDGQSQGDSKWVFSGWMFASSPGLSYMDHPIYDVWVLDCLTGQGDAVTDADFEGPADKMLADEGVVEEEFIPAQPITVDGGEGAEKKGEAEDATSSQPASDENQDSPE